MSTRTEFTFCRICEATCGLKATIEGDRVVALEPDEEHVEIDPEYYATVKGVLENLLDEMYSGSFWSSYARGARQIVKGALKQFGSPRKAA